MNISPTKLSSSAMTLQKSVLARLTMVLFMRR